MNLSLLKYQIMQCANNGEILENEKPSTEENSKEMNEIPQTKALKFKEKNDLCSRKVLADRAKSVKGDFVPLIIEKHSQSTLPTLTKEK